MTDLIQFMAGFSIQDWIAIVALIIGVLSFLVSYFFYRLNKQALKQADAHVKLQLYYKDKQEALFELNKLLSECDSKGIYEFEKRFDKLRDSIRGQYMPRELVSFINKEIQSIKAADKTEPQDYEPTDEEMLSSQESEEQWWESLDWWEIEQHEHERRASAFFTSTKNRILKCIKPEE